MFSILVLAFVRSSSRPRNLCLAPRSVQRKPLLQLSKLGTDNWNNLAMSLILNTGCVIILPKSSVCAPSQETQEFKRGYKSHLWIRLEAFTYTPFGNACSVLDCKRKLLWVTRKIHATHSLSAWWCWWTRAEVTEAKVPSLSNKVIANSLMSFPASMGCLAAVMMLWGGDKGCRKFLWGGYSDKEANKMSCNERQKALKSLRICGEFSGE